MTRGRRPLMALREAVLIAKKRGETRQFMHGPGTICNFVIYCLAFVAHVRIKRVTRVHCSPAWIEREVADALADLRAIASGSGISRELWVFLPRGRFRFFRVTDTGLHRDFPRRIGDAGKTGTGQFVHTRLGPGRKPHLRFEPAPEQQAVPAGAGPGPASPERPEKPEPAASPAGAGGQDIPGP